MTNKELISRFLKYRNLLLQLRNMGITKVISDIIADAASVSASQVRKDFASFKITGKKRGGYEIEKLISDIDSVLGHNELHKAIIIGCGRIGDALMNYRGFKQRNIEIVYGFDIDKETINPTKEIPVLPLKALEDVIKDNNISVAILTVPTTCASKIYEDLISIGIKGILNFTGTQLREVKDCTVINVNIEAELENLFYYVKLTETNKS